VFFRVHLFPHRAASLNSRIYPSRLAIKSKVTIHYEEAIIFLSAFMFCRKLCVGSITKSV
ncbi:MAG: hypothetical protein M3209_02875, partial [Acidobacteriota bacterium]|nr:hypothetical protein [Acidobacteriota bacterium]